MKKVLLLAIVATAFGMTSCKKEYTCSCTGGVVIDVKIPKTTKAQAKTTCEAAQTTYSTGTTATSCSLK